MLSVIIWTFIGLTSGQLRTCEFSGGPNGIYTLNLTSISDYHMEYKDVVNGINYYYTPCRNGERCTQGNADFYGNCVQFRPGQNQCLHWLSVDHHETPEYHFGSATWAFYYRDGQKCDATQEPRSLDIYYLCDELLPSGAWINDIYEPYMCSYRMQIRTPLACIPEGQHNANCQWRVPQKANNTYVYLDLSSQKGMVIRGHVEGPGYEQYYTPCQNGLHCYQQSGGDITVQSILANHETHTCELYLSEWQEGRVQPYFHNSEDEKLIHWSFHYLLSEKCMDGRPGEQTIRWYCDPDVVNNTLINATYDGNCKHEVNVASSLACPSNPIYHEIHGVNIEKLFAHSKQEKVLN